MQALRVCKYDCVRVMYARHWTCMYHNVCFVRHTVCQLWLSTRAQSVAQSTPPNDCNGIISTSEKWSDQDFDATSESITARCCWLDSITDPHAAAAGSIPRLGETATDFPQFKTIVIQNVPHSSFCSYHRKLYQRTLKQSLATYHTNYISNTYLWHNSISGCSFCIWSSPNPCIQSIKQEGMQYVKYCITTYVLYVFPIRLFIELFIFYLYNLTRLQLLLSQAPWL